MKIQDLFNKQWSQDTENFADVITEALLNEENPMFTSVQSATIFRELLCEVMTNNSTFELTDEVEVELIKKAEIYSTLIDMSGDGTISFANTEDGEEILIFKSEENLDI